MQDYFTGTPWEDISITNLIIIIISEVSILPIVAIYFRGCVPQMVVPSYALGFIYISHESWAVFYCCAVLWCVQMVMSILWTDSRICLFAHYTTSLSSICRRIRKYWISTILVKYTLSSVNLKLRQFSWVSFMQYMELFVLGLPIYLIMIVRINVLYLNIIIKSEVWPIRHCSW